MQVTQDSSDYINKEAVGYLLNVGLSRAGQNQVLAIQNKLVEAFANNLYRQG